MPPLAAPRSPAGRDAQMLVTASAFILVYQKDFLLVKLK